MSKHIRPTRPVLDLSKTHFETTIHGFRIVGTWWWDEDSRRYDPCLVILHPGRSPYASAGERRAVPCVIPLREAWRWALHDGIGDPKGIANTTREWFESGALPGDPHNPRDAMRLLNAVDARLRDLVLMPPKPPGELITIADVALLDPETGRILDEVEMKHDVH